MKSISEMLRIVRSLAVSRLGAALVALALTGLPRVATPGQAPGVHRCTCKAHGAHECTCPVCQAAAARAARLADAERLPPCHRAAAIAEAQRQAAGPQASGPCLRGSCGLPEQPRATPAGIEPFLIPIATGIAAPSPAGQPAGQQAAPRAVPREPETPPPRCA